jgi:hypothetical protein
MIPRKVSFFWSGRMSWLRYMTLASFRKWNPDWDMVLYVPKIPCIAKTWLSREMDDRGYTGKDYLQEVSPLGVEIQSIEALVTAGPAHVCDMVQWEVLAGEGGFFSDMDILYLKPMNHLGSSTMEFDAVFCLEGFGEMAIGFVGSAPDNHLFDLIGGCAANNYTQSTYQCTGTEAVYRAAGLWPVNLRQNPSAGRECIARFYEMFPSLKIGEVPPVTVYPLDWTKVADLYHCQSRPLPDETIGIHWFGGDPRSHQASLTWTGDPTTRGGGLLSSLL